MVMDFVVVLLHVLRRSNPHATKDTSARELSFGLATCEQHLPIVKTSMEGRLQYERRVGCTFIRCIWHSSLRRWSCRTNWLHGFGCSRLRALQMVIV